jgi:hypothetical protein
MKIIHEILQLDLRKVVMCFAVQILHNPECTNPAFDFFVAHTLPKAFLKTSGLGYEPK